MGPLLSSRLRMGTCLLGWIPIGALLFWAGSGLSWTLTEKAALILPLALLGPFLFLSSGYLCRAFPLPSPRMGTHGAAWLTAAAVMATLWASFGWVLAKSLARIPRLQALPSRALQAFPVLVGLGMVLYLAALAVHYLLDAVERARRSEAKGDELRILAQDAELRALRAQLNPHFLFNSLNSISALTTLDPARARTMCVLLSDFLRGSLKLGERRLVPLSEEMDLLRAYLAIEKIRFGDRLQVDWELDPGVLDEPLPALLLQPLVENAVKHGIAGLPEGGRILILARKEEGTVELRVENPVDLDMPSPEGLGLGLRQVRSRLQLRFGARMVFTAGIQEGLHTVRMLFPSDGRTSQEVLPHD